MIANIRKYFSSRVTFIGLGNMGYPMAKNLSLNKDFVVSGFDFNKDVEKKFKAEISDKTNDIIDSFKSSDYVVTMLPSAQTVKQNLDLAYKHSKKGTIFVDCSTISPLDALEISKNSKSKDFISADCPVSGGINGAINASLTFMIGSEPENYEKIKKVLTPMGKNFFDCGGVSKGQVAKICNNLCLGISMTAVSESLALGVKLGMDPKILSSIMGVSTSRCWSLDSYNPIPGIMENVPSSRDYERGFNVELMLKDLKIALECSKSKDLDLELASLVEKYYEEINNKLEANKKDFGIVYQYIINNRKKV